jgi:hypothetical protein
VGKVSFLPQYGTAYVRYDDQYAGYGCRATSGPTLFSPRWCQAVWMLIGRDPLRSLGKSCHSENTPSRWLG